MQKARRHPQSRAPTACRRMGSGSISPFCSKCFSPFLHSTCSLSVSQEYLALRMDPAGFSLDSSCPDLLRYRRRNGPVACKGLSPATAAISNAFHLWANTDLAALLPRACRNTHGLGYSPVARRYWGNHVVFFSCR